MSETPVITATESVSGQRLLGRVKWFNNKSGFGFITVCESDHNENGKDIFIHYSSIRGDLQQYKYLVQGEYVEFLLIKSESDDHEFHASDISGVKEGILMCETHRQNNTNVVRSQFVNRPRGRGNNPEDVNEYSNRPITHGSTTENEGFSEVKRRKKTSSATVSH
jgi:cold shock CspA family protein